MQLSPELITKIAGWRARAADGTITMEEMREGILLMRENRRSAAETAIKSKAKKSTAKSATDLLSELDSL